MIFLAVTMMMSMQHATMVPGIIQKCVRTWLMHMVVQSYAITACTLTIIEYSMFKRNNAEDGHGGAVASINGRISIHDSTLFDGNSASVGGAMNLEDTNLAISGNACLDLPSK
jgi:hypothetical protein